VQLPTKVSPNDDQVDKAATMAAEGAMNFMRSTISGNPGPFPSKHLSHVEVMLVHLLCACSMDILKFILFSITHIKVGKSFIIVSVQQVCNT
jgi:hypothetical protein